MVLAGLDAGAAHEDHFLLAQALGWTPEQAVGLLKEINNGRLAMIGIMGFLAEAKVPGSVPFLGGIVKPYAGNVMAPFAPDVHMLPQYVQ